jgi:hypothetical protein
MGNKSYETILQSTVPNQNTQNKKENLLFSRNYYSQENFEILHNFSFQSTSENIYSKEKRQKSTNSFISTRRSHTRQSLIIKPPSKSNIHNNIYNPFLSSNEETAIPPSKDSDFIDSYQGERANIKNGFEHIYYESITKVRYESHKGYSNNLISEVPEESTIKHSNSCFIKDSQNCEYELQMTNRNDKLRKAYISKLIATKAWQPMMKEKKHNSMIIFDWDDTLLCTSYLTPSGIFNEEFELSKKDKEKLAKLEGIVMKILKFALSNAHTYIITNAAPGWVEFSCRKFYPEVFKILQKITIISARGEYESVFPNEIKQWKIHAFLDMKKDFDSDLVSNIICMGDSVIEIEAAQILGSKFSQAFIKTIKFRETPKPEELMKQLGLINEQFANIYSSVKNLTIRVEKKGSKNK